MFNLLVKLMLLASLAQFGLSLFDFQNCHTRMCLVMFEKRSRDVLSVDWKPISVWPEEAKTFR